MSEKIEKKVQSTTEIEIGSDAWYRKIGLPIPNKKIHEVDVGDHIVQHYIHSYDEHGNVIVVEDEKEDLWKSIPQYQDEVGPKNVIRMIEAGGDPLKLLNANEGNAFFGDVSNMTAESVNEMKEKAFSFSEVAVKALDEFNSKFGTNLDMKSFIDLYEKGLLSAHVEGVNKTEVSTDGAK